VTSHLDTGGASGVIASESQRERIDVYAGALIALKGASEDLRADLDEARRRRLVWQGERHTLAGKVQHQVDWNPALDSLSKILDEVNGWLDGSLNAAALAYAHPSRGDETALQVSLARSGEALRVVGVYLAAIRAAQFALHDAPSYVAGGLGFNDGIIERVERLRGLLEALRSGADPAQLSARIGGAIDETTSYVDSYSRGLQDGAKLMETARVVGLVQGSAGMVRALAGIAQLLAGATVGGGELTYALAGAGSGAAVNAGAGAASIQGILKGLTVAMAAGSLSYRGGMEPVEMGREGERRAGIGGSKERIPSFTGTAEYRVPDHINELTIEEVKNVLKLSRTNQLRDFLDYARNTHRTFVLWIRPTTKLSGPLLEWIKAKSVMIKYIQ